MPARAQYEFGPGVFLKMGDCDRHMAEALHRAEAGNLDAAFQHQWDDLRADPRFDTCLARMGLP